MMGVRCGMGRFGRRIVTIACAAALLAGCSSIQPDRHAAQPTPIVPPAAPKSVGQPSAVTQEQARIAAAYGGVYQQPQLTALLNSIADRLAAASDRPDLRYKVTLLNSPLINAFALPNGSLYVTRGLLAVANDTSEVAGVLAHEMAHVTARHAFQRADEERKAVLVSKVVSDVLENREAGAVALAKSRLSLASFSRAQELEADRIGVQNIARAGFDPYGASRFLLSMGRQTELRSAALGQKPSQPGLDFLSTHPSTPERVQLAVTSARQIGAPGLGERDRDRYLTALNGIVYGDDPAQGYARGRRFLHPRLGFTFLAPEGFTFENGAEALLGVAPDGRALRLDAARLASGRTLDGYIQEGWIEGAEPGPVERLEVNGMEAVTIVAKGRDWTFRFVAIRFGDDVYRLIFAARELTPEIDDGFRASLQSFRRLSASEIESAQPLRVATETVRPGDTDAAFAARMALTDRAVERFAVLNGLAPGEPLQPGYKVKVIRE
ncbi:metalloprotease [Methylopila jiangsuensis]|uniref:Metalloprotease n=1 Tax=Methylopila jiangsuensis TaxID=586230 RepID=A0A9W6N3J3_9HYPH|nr:M48 family metalloprotease [Methylopila jiangsuensis]MDR6286358.1 putative Zn-dependent protease [Methylopila jiangsuensis]GLK76122.1 metalloprotease [Methylopila jiangsuensis]